VEDPAVRVALCPFCAAGRFGPVTRSGLGRPPVDGGQASGVQVCRESHALGATSSTGSSDGEWLESIKETS
jgi:hypothetical protein